MPDEDDGQRGGGAPAAPSQAAPGVIDNEGHYEVDPALMSVYPQFATDFEVDRIVKGRLEYLYWVQRHFADRVLPPHAEDAAE
jgi:hypothetical protein